MMNLVTICSTTTVSTLYFPLSRLRSSLLGISSRSHLPFSPPTSFRVSPRPNASKSKHEKSAMMEGSCHRCAKWVELEGIKVGDAKVRSVPFYSRWLYMLQVLTDVSLCQVKEIYW
jgi:hypothetical protein